MAPAQSSKDFFSLGGDSEDEGRGSESEQEQKSKTTTKKRGVKRRRLDDFGGSGSEESASESEGGSDDEKATSKSVGEDTVNGKSTSTKKEAHSKASKSTQLETTEQPDGEDNEEEEDERDIVNPAKLTPLTPAQLQESKAKLKRTGVVYLSSIPPFMKPPKVCHLLSPFGTINRIFLVPEDPKAYKARVRSGGNKRKKFVEGWVEFENKKNAKLCVETLNAQIVGGKKGNYYHDDVWNMKYLKGFKWGDLQAQIAYENASRQARLRAEISQATRENKAFLKNVEKAKMVENMESKKKKRKIESGEQDASGNVEEKVEVRRTFRQNELKGHSVKGAPKKERSEAVNRVLKKIF